MTESNMLFLQERQRSGYSAAVYVCFILSLITVILLRTYIVQNRQLLRVIRGNKIDRSIVISVLDDMTRNSDELVYISPAWYRFISTCVLDIDIRRLVQQSFQFIDMVSLSIFSRGHFLKFEHRSLVLRICANIVIYSFQFKQAKMISTTIGPLPS